MHCKLFAVLVLTAGLAACATPQLIFARKDGVRMRDDPAATDQFARDRYRCFQESRTSYQGYGVVGIAVAQAQAQDRANRLLLMCMDAAGYRPPTDAELAAARQPAAPSGVRQ